VAAQVQQPERRLGGIVDEVVVVDAGVEAGDAGAGRGRGSDTIVHRGAVPVGTLVDEGLGKRDPSVAAVLELAADLRVLGQSIRCGEVVAVAQGFVVVLPSLEPVVDGVDADGELVAGGHVVMHAGAIAAVGVGAELDTAPCHEQGLLGPGGVDAAGVAVAKEDGVGAAGELEPLGF